MENDILGYTSTKENVVHIRKRAFQKLRHRDFSDFIPEHSNAITSGRNKTPPIDPRRSPIPSASSMNIIREGRFAGANVKGSEEETRSLRKPIRRRSSLFNQVLEASRMENSVSKEIAMFAMCP